MCGLASRLSGHAAQRRQRGKKVALQLARQPAKLAVKPRSALERGHGLCRFVGGEVVVAGGHPFEVRRELLIAEHPSVGFGDDV